MTSQSIAGPLNLVGSPPEFREVAPVTRLSVARDLLAFRRCSRQYGLRAVRGFAPTNVTEEFVGAFVHRSLSRALRFFQTNAAVPGDSEMAEILEGVRGGLETEYAIPRGVTVSRTGYRLMRLNRSLGETGAYERIVDIGRALQSFEGAFVVEGVVDAVWTSGEAVELWDFKASSNPLAGSSFTPGSWNLSAGAARLDDYAFQMGVYAHLHERNYDVVPEVCRLLFIDEIPLGNVGEVSWNDYRAEPIANFSEPDSLPSIFLTIKTRDESLIKSIRKQFYLTADQVIKHIALDEWAAPQTLPSKSVCDKCDFRWSCESAREEFGYASELTPAPTLAETIQSNRWYSPGGDREARDLDESSADIYKVLRTWRNQVASGDRELKRRLRNDVLRDIAQLKPRCLSGLKEVPGMRPDLLDLYGRDLVAVVEAHFQVGRDAAQVLPMSSVPVPHVWPELTVALSERLYSAGILFLADLWQVSPTELFEDVGLSRREWLELKRFLGVTQLKPTDRTAAREFMKRVDSLSSDCE